MPLAIPSMAFPTAALGGSCGRSSGQAGARTIIVEPEAVEFFARLAGHRSNDEPLLQRSDGAFWGASHQVRPMKRALTGAGLDPSGRFYALRHSYISPAIEASVPLNIVAEKLRDKRAHDRDDLRQGARRKAARIHSEGRASTVLRSSYYTAHQLGSNPLPLRHELFITYLFLL